MQVLKLFPGVAYALRRLSGRILHTADIQIPSETAGSDYGAHTLPRDLLKSDSVVYSFGIGNDASFDLDIIERYGCNVHGFDPTPTCKKWVEKQAFPSQFIFHPIGLGEIDSLIGFQSPEKEGNVSFFRAKNNSIELTLPVKRLSTIMAELGDTQIDVLKLDIEGFEYQVLPDILLSRIYPKVLAVEFHHRMYGYEDASTISAVNSLRDAGFKLFFVAKTGREYSFIYSP
jgi:FkbM family methyltransferase